MAKVEYIDMLPATSELYYKSLTPQDRFTHARVTKKVTHFSRKKVKGLTQKSLLPQVSQAWALLSPAEKTAWTTGGVPRNLNGWRLFVQDKCARIKNDLAGNATPTILHQSWVGNLKIEAPASELKIVQNHPVFYWVYKKVTGKKGMYEPVKVTEGFALPLVLTLSYSSNLTSTGAGSFAKFYAVVWSSYQGVDRQTVVEIPMDLISDWKTVSATLSWVYGHVIGYTLYFHLYNVQGDVYIDNVKATHSGQNWVRDTYCEDILRGFTRAFYQIPDHWAAEILPAGAFYDSIYEDF